LIVIYVHSIYCPKCEIFKYGILDMGERRIESELYSGYRIVKDVCEIVGIPMVDLDVGTNYDLEAPIVVNTRKGRIEERRVAWSIQRYWLSQVLGVSTIELPGICIVSSAPNVKNRYVSVEIVTEARKIENAVISHYVAARQVLRAMARTAIEEALAPRFKEVPVELVESIMNRVFPRENGRDEPDLKKWVSGFIKVKKLVIR